jgi:hypothetical protein
VTTPPSLAVQVVLYDNDRAALVRQAERVAGALRCAFESASVGELAVRYGDCGEVPSLDAAALTGIESVFDGLVKPTLTIFGANLGSGGGSNALAAEGTEDALLVLNPDAFPSPTTIVRLLDRLGHGVAAADARQLPLEHPKQFDAETGDTSWVSGACAVFDRQAFEAVGGFDAVHFPMYCDDVDISWRLRGAGWRTVHAPEAIVVHDKRLGPNSWPVATDVQQRSWTVAALFLYRRYDRPDLTEAMLTQLQRGDAAEWEREALAEYLDRAAADPDPAPVADVSVATFAAGFDAPHRFRWGVPAEHDRSPA